MLPIVVDVEQIQRRPELQIVVNAIVGVGCVVIIASVTLIIPAVNFIVVAVVDIVVNCVNGPTNDLPRSSCRLSQG